MLTEKWNCAVDFLSMLVMLNRQMGLAAESEKLFGKRF
jgi:hypothetical protein